MNLPTPKGIRLEAGFEIVETTTEMARRLGLPFVDITGFGELEWVELGDSDDKTIERLNGPFQLLDFKGRARFAGNLTLVDYVCTLSKKTDSGIQLTGGRLLRAQTCFAELTLTPLTEPTDTEKTTQTPSQNEPSPFASKVEEEPALSTESELSASPVDDKWKVAIQESEIIRRHAAKTHLFDDETEFRPSRGDIVEHLHFGRCSVTRIDDDYITLRKPNGHNVQLGLTILKFTPAGEEENHSVFQVVVKRK
jgi:hypothetical protein